MVPPSHKRVKTWKTCKSMFALLNLRINPLFRAAQWVYVCLLNRFILCTVYKGLCRYTAITAGQQKADGAPLWKLTGAGLRGVWDYPHNICNNFIDPQWRRILNPYSIKSVKNQSPRCLQSQQTNSSQSCFVRIIKIIRTCITQQFHLY